MDQSSLSSLGSLLDTNSVANYFKKESASQPRLSYKHSKPIQSQRMASSKTSMKKQHTASSSLPAPDTPSNRICPHCKKVFSHSWAMPRHVIRIHDRTGMLHCPKCSFKHPKKSALDDHDRAAHRTCPRCRKVFSFLERHTKTCLKQ